MDSGTALRMTVGAALIVIIIAVTISISSSLSVGGIVYSGESEACASCHIEVPYVEGWKGSPHEKGNITCMDCHQYRRFITDDQCLTCHQDYDVTNIIFPWFWVEEIREIDAHDKDAHIPAKCTTCHIEHKFELGIPRPVTVSRCRDCHGEYIPLLP